MVGVGTDLERLRILLPFEYEGLSEDERAAVKDAAGMLVDLRGRGYEFGIGRANRLDVVPPPGVEESPERPEIDRLAPALVYALRIGTGENPKSSSSSSPKGNDDDDFAGTPRKAPSEVADRLAAAMGTVGTLSAKYSAEVEYVVDPYIARGQVTFVVGAPESMKSWLMADLARAVQTGGSWLGSMKVTPGRVIYFEQERAKNLVYQTALLSTGWKQDLSGIITFEPCGLDLCHPEWQAAVIATVETQRPDVVILNSYRAVFRGRPPDSSDVAGALGWIGSLAERVNCAVVVVDGTNKVGALGRARGAEAHADSVQKQYEADTILHVERKRDELGRGVGPARVYFSKQRYGTKEAPRPFIFDLIPDGPADAWKGGVRVLWTDETTIDQDVATSPKNAVERVYDGLPDVGTRSIKELKLATGLVEGSVKNALRQLRDAGRAEAPERGKWRRRAKSSSSPPLGGDDDDYFAADAEAEAAVAPAMRSLIPKADGAEGLEGG